MLEESRQLISIFLKGYRDQSSKRHMGGRRAEFNADSDYRIKKQRKGTTL